MSSLDDLFSEKKEDSSPKNLGTKVDIEVACDECHVSADSVFYKKEVKKVITICENGHQISLDMDLSWLIH